MDDHDVPDDGTQNGSRFLSPRAFLRASGVIKHPLDIDALALELALTDSHAIESFGDRWAVTCSHVEPAVLRHDRAGPDGVVHAPTVAEAMARSRANSSSV